MVESFYPAKRSTPAPPRTAPAEYSGQHQNHQRRSENRRRGSHRLRGIAGEGAGSGAEGMAVA